MSAEILSVLESLEREKGISKEILFEAIEAALLSAARKMLGKDKEDISVKVDRATGDIKVFSGKKKVDSGEFGRIAAQTAKQVIIQKIREAEKDVIFEDYSNKKGSIATGLVHRFEKGNIVVDLGKTEAVLPRSEQIQKEKYKQGDRVRAYILEVNRASHGPQIVLSRRSPEFVRKLFELEVPEILEGIVGIRTIAREAGERTKMAVYSKDDKVDPVGSCVGMRGSRVKDIVRELHGERIDIVRYSDDISTYLKNAISPAEVAKIKIDRENKRIELIVKNDQLSIGIGKHGQNVRLASRLIDWEIDIRGEGELKEKEKVKEKDKKEKKREVKLSKVKGVGKKAEKILIEAGFDAVSKLASSNAEELTKLEGIGKKTAEKIIVSAKELLKG